MTDIINNAVNSLTRNAKFKQLTSEQHHRIGRYLPQKLLQLKEGQNPEAGAYRSINEIKH